MSSAVMNDEDINCQLLVTCINNFNISFSDFDATAENCHTSSQLDNAIGEGFVVVNCHTTSRQYSI